MYPIEYFSGLVCQHKNSAVVCDIVIEDDGKLYSCYVNPWNGMVTVLQHVKNTNDGLGRQIGSIFLDDDDNITTEIFQ